MGDFNCNPLALIPEEANAKRLTDLSAMHLQCNGTPMPPTCKEVTITDNAILSPQVANWVSGVQVCPPGDFDTHQVVLFNLRIPTQTMMTRCLKLPRTWAELNIDMQYLPEAYDLAVQRQGQPTDLESWGATVECAVDLTYRQTQAAMGTHPYAIQGLSRAYRGRCRPRRPRLIQRTLLPKVGRPGDFAAAQEVTRYATLHKVKQVRRVQSLYNRLKGALQLPSYHQWHELHLEWTAILRATAFGSNFILWCQHQPELGPPAMFLPTVDYIHTLLQLIKHQTQHDLAVDKRINRDRAQYVSFLDRKLGGNKRAFATIKEHAMPPLTEVATKLQEDAIVVHNETGTVTAYCDHPQAFSVACTVELQDIPCRIESADAFSLTLRPDQPLSPEVVECQISQEKIHADPKAILELLTNYWWPYWNSHEVRPGAQEAFHSLLQSLAFARPGLTT